MSVMTRLVARTILRMLIVTIESLATKVSVLNGDVNSSYTTTLAMTMLTAPLMSALK